MGGLYDGFFPWKNAQNISLPSQHLLSKSSYGLNDLYVGIFIQIFFKVNVAKNDKMMIILCDHAVFVNQ